MPEIYDIYHDESQEESYWHGFLFVPRKERQYLLDLLMKARTGAKWNKSISFKEINKRTGRGSPRTKLIGSWLSIALASLQQQKLLGLPTPFYLSGQPRCYIRSLERLIGCKFVVFKERDKHEKMFSGLSDLERIETTFRMGIKGGTHRLFNEQKPITIGNVFIDGDNHYIRRFGRTFDVKRGLRRFVMEKKPYVDFITKAKFIPQCSDHLKIGPRRSADDSQFLQLCDILLGGIRFHSYCPDSQHIKYKISSPCKLLLKRDTNNFPRMQQSRFSNAFTFGETWLEDEFWKFASLVLGEDKNAPKTTQLQLFI